MHSTPHRSLSSSYSSDQFAQIASRVVEKVRNESNVDPHHDFSDQEPKIENGFLEEFHKNTHTGSGSREDFGENSPKESGIDYQFREIDQKENVSREEFSENADKQGGFREEFEFQFKKEANVLEDSVKKFRNEEEQEKEDEKEEFEFPLIARNSVSSPALADKIFHNGRILPMYSFTGINSKPRENVATKPGEKASARVRMPLRLLFVVDTDPPSCSSSEADDLDGVPPETYCVWKPKMMLEEEEGQCKKSYSTGSSKRWKFKNFLNRSNSEGGRDRIVFPAPDENNGKKRDDKFDKSKGVGVKPAVAEQYVKCGGGDKRR